MPCFFFVAIVFFSAVLKIKDNFFFLQASQETSPQPGTALLCQKPQSPGTRKALLRSLWQLRTWTVVFIELKYILLGDDNYEYRFAGDTD